MEIDGSHGAIALKGTELHFVAEGKGMACVVIGSSIYYPRTFSRHLRDNLRLYFVDMRWFTGEYSPNYVKDFTLQNIIDDIDKISTALKLDKFIIMGHSIHGTIAFEFARIHPEKVIHVIMIGSPNIAGNQEQEDAITELWNTASEERKQIQNNNICMM
jgi:proline iminopeptidase